MEVEREKSQANQDLARDEIMCVLPWQLLVGNQSQADHLFQIITSIPKYLLLNEYQQQPASTAQQ